MEIIFEKENDREILIKNKESGKTVGRIFTPSGSGRTNDSCIQVCGFSDAFEYWSCGVFFDTKCNPKKDMQFYFEPNSTGTDEFTLTNVKFKNKKERILNPTINDCSRCFYQKDKCICSTEFQVLNREDDLMKKYLLKGLG